VNSVWWIHSIRELLSRVQTLEKRLVLGAKRWLVTLEFGFQPGVLFPALVALLWFHSSQKDYLFPDWFCGCWLRSSSEG
jgi:hypothetical protein